MKLGNARYGAEYTKKKWFKLKDGESVFRILPPMGEYADRGIWSEYYGVHYGYRTTDNKTRTFLSPLVVNKANKMVEKPDAALELINNFKSQIDAAKLAGDKAKVERLQEFVGGQKSRFNLDKNHYMNAMDLQGNIGVLKLRHRAKIALDATIKSLRAKGIDPLSPTDGRFFVFRRSGNALETTFQVEVYSKDIQTEAYGVVKQDVIHTLTPDVIDRLKAEAVELGSLFRTLTSEEVSAIVAGVDIKTGISTAADAIFASKGVAATAGDDDSDDLPVSTNTNRITTTGVITPAAQAPAATPFVGYNQPVQAQAPAAPVQAESYSIPQTKAAPAVMTQAYIPPAAPVAPAGTPLSTALASDSELDFLKKLGVSLPQ